MIQHTGQPPLILSFAFSDQISSEYNIDFFAPKEPHKAIFQLKEKKKCIFVI